MRVAVIGAGPVGMAVVSALLSGKDKNDELFWVVRNEGLRKLLSADGIFLYFQKRRKSAVNYSPSRREKLSELEPSDDRENPLALHHIIEQAFCGEPDLRLKMDSVKLLPSVQALKEAEPELVISCVKAYDVLPLRSELRGVGKLKLFIANGFWLHPGLDLGVFFGGGFSKDNKVSLSRSGRLLIGRVKSPHAEFLFSFTEEQPAGALVFSLAELDLLENFEKRLNKKILQVQLCQDIYPIMLKKAIINCVVNPLSALSLSENGALLNAWSQIVIQAMLAEILTALKSAHFLLEEYAELRYENILEECLRVLAQTKANISSMTMDVLKGRTTEVRFLNQIAISLGQRYGIEMPVNATVVSLLQKGVFSQFLP